MKALVYNGPRDVSIREVPDATTQRPADVVITPTTSASVKATGGIGVVGVCVPEDPEADAYKPFDDRDEGWTKVILTPAA